MKPTFNTLYIALALFFSVEIDSQNSFQEITTIEEIVVTSRRREESAQTVPVAISAYTENDLVSKLLQLLMMSIILLQISHSSKMVRLEMHPL